MIYYENISKFVCVYYYNNYCKCNTIIWFVFQLQYNENYNTYFEEITRKAIKVCR